MSFCTVGLPYGADFLCDIDPYRTPCNTTAASHTAGRLKLIDPCRQLMRHPLPVTGKSRWPHRTSMDVRMIGGETRVPAAPPLGMIAGEIVHLFHRAAEARG